MSKGTLSLFDPPASAPEPPVEKSTPKTFDKPAAKVRAANKEEGEGRNVAITPERQEVYRRGAGLTGQRWVFWRQLQQADNGLAGGEAHPEPPTPQEIDRCVNWILRGVASDVPEVTAERIEKATEDLAAYGWAIGVEPDDWQPQEWPAGEPFDLLAKRAAAFPYTVSKPSQEPEIVPFQGNAAIAYSNAVEAMVSGTGEEEDEMAEAMWDLLDGQEPRRLAPRRRL